MKMNEDEHNYSPEMTRAIESMYDAMIERIGNSMATEIDKEILKEIDKIHTPYEGVLEKDTILDDFTEDANG